MSVVNSFDAKVDIVPWMGSMSCTKSFTIAVLSSSQQIIENIWEVLNEVHSKGSYRWKLNVLRSFNLEALLEQAHRTGKIAIDFIVIALDTSNVLCLEVTQSILKQVHPDLRSRRVVLVNAGNLPANSMAVSASELISFSSDFELDLLNGNVFIKDDAMFLARRLLKYLEVSVGVKTGIPNINL